MSAWKVILASILIFSAGVLTGTFVSRPAAPPPPAKASGTHDAYGPTPWFVRKEFLTRLDQKLTLTPAQHERIARILEASQERAKTITSRVWPELKEELRSVREQINAELTPEQKPKFEELLQRGRQRSHGGTRDERRPATNSPPPGVEPKPARQP